MAKVLVVDDEPHIREVVRRFLTREGYDVIEAEDGAEALEKVGQEAPDIILLDVQMPQMDGFEVLKRLREDPATRAMPVILLTTITHRQGEIVRMRLGVNHYVTKPPDPDTLKLTIKVALREAETAREKRGDISRGGQGSTSHPSTDIAPEAHPPIKSGIEVLDTRLGGGISIGSLTLIEGASGAGKSVLSQQLAYGALEGGHGVAYFSSEETDQSFISRMSSIGLDVSDYIPRGQLHAVPLEEPSPDEASEHLLASLLQQIKGLSSQYDTIMVDSITDLSVYSQDRAVIGFFQSCKGICKSGRTIFLVAHSASLEEKMLVRLRSLLDTHIRLSPKKMGRKQVKILEVFKINNTDVNTDNSIAFDVRQGMGLLPIPISQFTI